MKLNKLTKEDWDTVGKMINKREGESAYTLENRIKLFNQVRDSYLSGATRITGYLQEAIKQAFGKSYKKIPLLLQNAEPIEKAIFKYRLEKGL